MIGSRQMERVLSEARRHGAKVVLVGDPEQLQAIEAGAAFRAVAERGGAVEITEVRRQREEWQRDATRQLATGRTQEALNAHSAHGHVHATETREAARAELIDRWDAARQASPDATRLILAHTNADVDALNSAARGKLRSAGELGEEVTVATERGERAFATGDRVMFRRNERSMGVKNGTLGTVEQVTPQHMAVRLDDGRQVGFDLKDYANIDHGYAATIHKAQGVTVDHTHVLATPGLDRHAAYVALSRHRTSVDMHHGRDDFASPDRLVNTLGRDRAKDTTLDYGRDYADRRSLTGDIRNRIEDGWKRLKAAVVDHARTVSTIFRQQDRGETTLPDQRQQLASSRQALNNAMPEASRDAERAYKAEPELAHETAQGRTGRIIRALQLEAELRHSAPARADRFVEDWTRLGEASQRAYRAGDIRGYRAVRDQMGAMAKSLERDPQLESVLRGRERQLSIGGIEEGSGLSRRLAISIGFDLGRGRSLGL